MVVLMAGLMVELLVVRLVPNMAVCLVELLEHSAADLKDQLMAGL